MRYEEFLKCKSQSDFNCGFKSLFMPDYLFDFQKELVDWAIRKGRAAIFADCGLGKGQPYGTKVLTSKGWTDNDKLSVGKDMIIASNGLKYPLNGIYPRTKQDTYRIYFSDRSSFVVDKDHLHIIRTNNDRQRKKPWRILSTNFFLECNNLRYGKDRSSRSYDIPVVSPVSFDRDRKVKKVTPYVIGCLLGDGYLENYGVSISSNDVELLDKFSKNLPEGVFLKKRKNSKYDYSIMTGLTGTCRHPFRQELFELGMMNKRSHEKFIPDDFLYGSIQERLELLRGLMDTDGYIMECGTCDFGSSSKKLAEGVLFLVRSLGGIPTFSKKKVFLNGKRCRDSYSVIFSLKTFNPFSLTRKMIRWNPNPRDNGRWIDRIEYEKQQETICLSVDSPDSSYVTEHFIVTHNTPMQLVWAENIVKKTNKPVLVITPLSVSPQTIREGEKFGIECTRSIDGNFNSKNKIIVTNYERLHYFDSNEFSGLVCDESSIIKNFDGSRRKIVTQFMKKIPYRLLCTATAAPNDYIELGTSSEALGQLGRMDMLGTFFKNDENSLHPIWWGARWRFKAHAEKMFWRWVCSWAKALRKPSDLGFDDNDFILPDLIVNEIIVRASRPLKGRFFITPAITLDEQRMERRATIMPRCEMVAEKVNGDFPAVVWCHLNDEANLLEKIIPDAVQVSGSDSDEIKEKIFLDFVDGNIRVLITKPKIGAFGLNWQHCSNMTFFPSHSFEQYYQGTRRCWRFGQKNKVKVDIITTEGETGVLMNLQRKMEAAEKMFSQLILEMNKELRMQRTEKYEMKVRTPEWL